METKSIRVIRTTTITKTEETVVAVTKADGEYKSHRALAEEYVRACTNAGVAIHWKVTSEELQKYPAPSIEAEDDEVHPAPPHVERPRNSDDLEPI